MAFISLFPAKRLKHAIAQCSITTVGLAVITVAAYRFQLNLATVSLLYVIVIVLLARAGDFVPSLLCSIIATLLLADIAPPAHSFRVDDPFDVVAIVAFLAVSLTIARLVSRLRAMSEEALSSVHRKLIDAEERVRGRIGKELHDDIEQRLALLSIEVAGLGQDPLVSQTNDSIHSIDRIQKQISKVATDVQLLAYELRPYKLEFLGLARAMKSLCEKFSQQHNVEIDFESHDLPAVPPDISLALMRVLQEALHNSTRHSGTRNFEVELFGASEAIHLAIRDSGVGFNPKSAMKGPGLGLMSMQERLKLVNGELSIDSQLSRGSTIHAYVLLPVQPTRNFRAALGVSA